MVQVQAVKTEDSGDFGVSSLLRDRIKNFGEKTSQFVI